ncbi:MAG: NusG domain II-containing protein [Clostridiales bacterium]|nr:NusG domain II-containing protein [Clostridiales bacterium]
MGIGIKGKKLKIGDVLVYIFIVLLTGLSFMGLKIMAGQGDEVLVQIELNGRALESIKMRQNWAEDFREIRVDTGQGGYNTIRISSEGVDIVDANCPDKLCVHSPTIKVPGQSIVCIPHKLMVRIIGNSQVDNAVDDTAS